MRLVIFISRIFPNSFTPVAIVAALFFLIFDTVLVSAENSVIINGIEYKNVDPGPAFVEDPRPIQNWQPPEASKLDVARGMILYSSSDPGEFRNYRIPKPDERISELKMSITPGETMASWFGIWALKNISNLSVEITGAEGLEFEVRRIHCWPQRSTWFNSRTYHIVPELLLKQENGKTETPLNGGVLQWQDFNVKKGSTVGFWITARLSNTIKSGKYTARIKISSKGTQTIEIPLILEVYPFVLPEKPDNRRWILYAWPNRYKAGADPMKDFNDMVAHGIDGFLDNAYLVAEVTKDANGKLQINDADNTLHWVRELIVPAQKAGMRGPFGMWTTPTNRNLAKTLNVNMKRPWPKEMQDGVKQIFDYFRTNYEKLGINDWMVFASDEPKPGNVYAIEALKAWKRAGAKTYCTAYMGTYKETAKWITEACIGYGDRQSRELIAQNQARQWIIGDGTYIGPYEMARYRRRVGVNFFLSGAYGCAIWRWGGCHGDPFNDFDGKQDRPAEPADQLLAYPQMLKPNDWKSYVGPIPTIGWESIRDGINDYRYLALLDETVKEALLSENAVVRSYANALLSKINL